MEMPTNTNNLKGDFVAPTVEVLPGNAQDAAHLVEEVSDDPAKPLWYLAYGSNLNSKAFKSRRGICPLAKRSVFVPGLELTFDLGGLPFVEPRFANARFVSKPDSEARRDVKEGKVAYDWAKPWTGRGALLGVAYLVTPTDFGRILATEGGGGSYKMAAVEAHVFACDAYLGPSNSGAANGNGNGTTMPALTGEKLRAFTLVSAQRTRPSEGLSSLRYLNLIRAGAEGAFILLSAGFLQPDFRSTKNTPSHSPTGPISLPCRITAQAPQDAKSDVSSCKSFSTLS